MSSVFSEKQENNCLIALNIICTVVRKPAVLSSWDSEWRHELVVPSVLLLNLLLNQVIQNVMRNQIAVFAQVQAVQSRMVSQPKANESGIGAQSSLVPVSKQQVKSSADGVDVHTREKKDDLPGSLPNSGRPFARTKCPKVAPTGRTFTAATTEGVLVYSVDESVILDPTDLDICYTRGYRWSRTMLSMEALECVPQSGFILEFVNGENKYARGVSQSNRTDFGESWGISNFDLTEPFGISAESWATDSWLHDPT
ncbi:hypothetical protein K1719_034370 [Acacia pycnantha]|nr:hypothetical protein K1719_034370 [Acacia pycnantha]